MKLNVSGKADGEPLGWYLFSGIEACEGDAMAALIDCAATDSLWRDGRGGARPKNGDRRPGSECLAPAKPALIHRYQRQHSLRAARQSLSRSTYDDGACAHHDSEAIAISATAKARISMIITAYMARRDR